MPKSSAANSLVDKILGSWLTISVSAAMVKISAGGWGILIAPQTTMMTIMSSAETLAHTRISCSLPPASCFLRANCPMTNPVIATFANITKKLRPGKPVMLKICNAGGKRHWDFASNTNHHSPATGAMNLINSTDAQAIGIASSLNIPVSRV